MCKHCVERSHKLTMVSFNWHGASRTTFVMLPVGDDGKVHYDVVTLARKLGVGPSDVIGIGQ